MDDAAAIGRLLKQGRANYGDVGRLVFFQTMAPSSNAKPANRNIYIHTLSSRGASDSSDAA